MPASESRASLRVDLLPGQHDVEIQVNRLEWTLDGPHTVIPLVSGEGFSIRLGELHDHELRLKTGGVPARVALLDAEVHHEETARRDRHRPAIRTSQLKAFAETSRAAAGPRTRVVVLCDQEPPIEVGVIESRYEVTSMSAELVQGDDERLLAVDWEEVSEWPNRCIRIWGRSATDPVLVFSVPVGERSAVIDLGQVDDGQFLVEVGVAQNHLAARRPSGGGGAQHIYLGSESAIRLRGAVEAGDRSVQFDAEELDELVPLLADLLIEQREDREEYVSETEGRWSLAEEMSRQGEDLPSRGRRLALLELIADEHWRLDRRRRRVGRSLRRPRTAPTRVG